MYSLMVGLAFEFINEFTSVMRTVFRIICFGYVLSRAMSVGDNGFLYIITQLP